ncbi:MAG: AmmeMemoRadiSam system protein B [Candidatus Zixiibacteriota bacterium]|nr:MAG: AmmeMemoRadiSam system protein B [candidate division Zixibacteria bacterium]
MAESDRGNVRRPAVAGSFYPAGPAELAKTIARMMSEVEKVSLENRPLGLIAPHAGYPYSGKVAAKAYKLLEGEEYDSVVVVSPSHTVFFKGSSVFDGSGYQTPLGLVEVDGQLAEKIASINPTAVYTSNMGHATGATRGEHALEVQLPFLQIVLGKFKLVPIVMGDQEEETIRSLGETLGAALQGTNTLMVASTDLSHFHSEDTARKLDFAVQEAIERYDPEALGKVLSSGEGEACGGGPVSSVMMAAKRLGGDRVQFLEYATSGAVTGDFDEVVGYLSAVIVAGKQAKTVKSVIGERAAAPSEDKILTDTDKQELRQMARDAIEAKLQDLPHESMPVKKFERKSGAFVTLKIDGQLRGCIGQIIAREPLYKIVADMAVAAAFEDPRFPPLTAVEFPKIELDISILTPLEKVHDLEEIEVGRDGLMIKLDMHSGLLLPQVATENNWDRTTFLEQTCLKAGLPKNSYRDRHAEIYKFSAEVI